MATIAEALALAVQHHQAGRFQAAEQIYRQILAIEPNHSDALHLLGVIAYQTGRNDVAIEYIERAIRLKGTVAAWHNNLGVAYSAAGKLPESVACLRNALKLSPDYADAHNNLGLSLSNQGHLDEAVACIQRALELSPNNADAHNNLGAALRKQGHSDRACACFQRALELKPDHVNALRNLGIEHLGVGDFDEAQRCWREALRHAPGDATILGDIAKMLRNKLPEEDLATMRRRVTDPDLTEGQRSALHFGLAHVLDARGNYAESAEHLNHGNSLRLSERRNRGQIYDPVEDERYVASLIETLSPDYFKRVSGFGLESDRPIFVFGLARTGTTLIEQILAGQSQVFTAGELGLGRVAIESLPQVVSNPASAIECLGNLDRQSVERMARHCLDRLEVLNNQAPRVVDKMPGNYLHIGLLATLFPRAKFIYCRRDIRDVALSCWMTEFQDLLWADHQEHIVSRIRTHERLMDHWRNVLPVTMLEVAYEETVADPERTARRLVDWCGLEWESGCVAFHERRQPVQTASAMQIRQPIYRNAVGRWKHYEDLLAPFFALL